MSAIDRFAAAAPPPVPLTGPAPGTVDPRSASPAPRPVRRRLATTPSRLAALSLLSAVAALLFGVLGGWAVRAQAVALDDARGHAEQLVRLQTIRINLVQADAAASNAFLAGGLEDLDQRQQYVTSVDTVAVTLAEAASHAFPTDVDRLAAANRALGTYTGLIESARANNRQHHPVGAAYLRQGSTLARGEMRDQLAALSADAAARVEGAYADAGRARALLVAGAGVALLVLLGSEIWLARRVRRYVNVPLGGATLIVLVVGLVALATMSWSQSHADQVQDHAYAATLALAQARTAAYDAKSDESQTLIFQGSGAGDPRWKPLDAEVVRQLTLAAQAGAPDLADELAAWRTVHERIRALDDAGNWAAAVDVATGEGDGSSNAAFGTFADASAKALDGQAGEVTDDLSSASAPLTILAVAVLVAGALAALAARRGFDQRLAEYR